MKISNKVLGVLGMAAAPFLGLETHFFIKAGMHNTSLTGTCDLIYMLGWAGSIVALLRLRAAGDTKVGRAVLYAQLGCLAMACIWNAWVIVAPNSEGSVFRFFDAFWPISNVFMLATGAAVARARRLRGWARWVPLGVGCWFPFTMLLGLAFGRSEVVLYGMTGYSVVAWFCLGLVVFRLPVPRPSTVHAPALPVQEAEYALGAGQA
ncbi:hypothetical protein [Hymenobacter ruricola]|uniref:DUF998 domain-containing protein n=1 Tax=Hymenobacter ruricola TaxID=2791023 RepID=A0ABS0HYQ3_9BACT|nr:hypothetical protein [Hymenobacter ruricola]MBF9219828.1 hypothetical protein [Hymenobacter ruricola]